MGIQRRANMKGKNIRHTATILVVLSALSADALPQLVQSYGLPQGDPIGQGSSSSGGYGRSCNGDEVRNVLGECVLPEISRNIFVYAAPKVISRPRPPPSLPKPEVHYNFVFVKTADLAQQNDPIIVPPPQHKTLVYVLSKKQQQGGESIIQTPYSPAPRPEVFYVNYGEGDNPQLPGGVDLQTALNSGATQGQNLNFQNANFGNSQNQGSNFVGDIIDGGTISGGLVNTPINSPAIDGGFINGPNIDGGFINGGFVNGDIIDSGFGGGISLGQGSIDSGFGGGSIGQVQDQPSGSSIFLQNQGSTGVQNQNASPGYPSQTPSPSFDFPSPSSPTGTQAPSLPPSRPGQIYENPN